VIAEVNRRMPRTHGDTIIHVSRISRLWKPTGRCLSLHAEPCHRDAHARGAQRGLAHSRRSYAADRHRRHLRSGAALPGDKRDLGIHTEMVPDGVIDLIEPA
jgi:4-hydroxybutyrate CoA-transferase